MAAKFEIGPDETILRSVPPGKTGEARLIEVLTRGRIILTNRRVHFFFRRSLATHERKTFDLRNVDSVTVVRRALMSMVVGVAIQGFAGGLWLYRAASTSSGPDRSAFLVLSGIAFVGGLILWRLAFPRFVVVRSAGDEIAIRLKHLGVQDVGTFGDAVFRAKDALQNAAGGAQSVSSERPSVLDRLRTLQLLKEKDLISAAEFDLKRTELLREI